MKTALELMQATLMVPLNSDEAIRLYKIIEQYNDLTNFLESRKVLSDSRVKKLEEQVQRQIAVIDNLEKTLWSKK